MPTSDDRRLTTDLWCKILGVNPAVVSTTAAADLVGTWLSLVEHSLGVRGVGSSNLPVPTNLSAASLWASRIDLQASQQVDGATHVSDI